MKSNNFSSMTLSPEMHNNRDIDIIMISQTSKFFIKLTVYEKMIFFIFFYYQQNKKKLIIS